MQKLLACSYDKIQPLGKGGILLMLVVLHMCSAHTLLCSRNHFWKLLMCISLGLFSLFLLPLRLQGHKGHKGRVVCKKKRRKLYSFTQRMDVSEVLPHTYPSHVQNLANGIAIHQVLEMDGAVCNVQNSYGNECPSTGHRKIFE